jgi:predicted amidophosphoribosyltransferase
MQRRYVHWFGNESSVDILEAYGIKTSDNMSINSLNQKVCPNCAENNTHDAKWCSKCKMLISFEGYQEALESQKQKEDQLKAVQSQLDSMQSQIQSLMSAFSNMQEQPQVDSMAKTLYSSGLLIKAADKNNAKEQLIKAASKAAYHATRTKSALTKDIKTKSS